MDTDGHSVERVDDSGVLVSRMGSATDFGCISRSRSIVVGCNWIRYGMDVPGHHFHSGGGLVVNRSGLQICVTFFRFLANMGRRLAQSGRASGIPARSMLSLKTARRSA